MDTAEIKKEMERCREQLAVLEDEQQTLSAKMRPLRDEFEHWSGILKIREGAMHAGSNAPPLPPPELPKAPEYGAKARAMRDFVLSRNGSGVTMREIIEAATKVSTHTAFAYQWVNRQRNAKPPKLEKRGKKFFATEALRAE